MTALSFKELEKTVMQPVMPITFENIDVILTNEVLSLKTFLKYFKTTYLKKHLEVRPLLSYFEQEDQLKFESVKA